MRNINKCKPAFFTVFTFLLLSSFFFKGDVPHDRGPEPRDAHEQPGPHGGAPWSDQRRCGNSEGQEDEPVGAGEEG